MGGAQQFRERFRTGWFLDSLYLRGRVKFAREGSQPFGRCAWMTAHPEVIPL